MEIELDEVKKWFSEYHINMPKLNEKANVSAEVLHEVNGNKIVIHKMTSEMPLIFSSRCFFVTYYFIE